MDNFSQTAGLLHEAIDAVGTIPGVLVPNGLTASETIVLLSHFSSLRRTLAEAEVAIQSATRMSRP